MEMILQDIQRALDAGASYAALAATVTLPEVCGRCEQSDLFSTKGENRGERVFQRFVETYLPDWDIGLDGTDLYYMRNGLSHRGQTTQRNKPLRYVFSPPNTDNFVHNNKGFVDEEMQTLQIDLRKFCNDISDAVRRWEQSNADNPIVQENLEDVLKTREGSFGTGIYIEGAHWVA
ncbi:hypothetical protein [Fodinicurvata fenggangensis]|uniref:hypothetical protein n=1 Tax=Fodinicurvata fenggangensis TaxID=1121830 RepID=UPI0012DC009D|nr:hypothetical protein [Fodinicurvata fenggangensis]